MMVEPQRDILLGPLLRTGLMRAWAARDHFLRLSVVPLAVMLAVLIPLRQIVITALSNRDVGESDATPQIAVLGLVYGAALAVFAVNWLRQLTLGTSAAPGLGLALGARHLRFFFLILATSMSSSILAIILMVVLSAFGMAGVMAGLIASLLIWASLLVRLSPSWIGIAIDAPMPVGVAWRRTAGQGFKLLIALLAVEVPLMFVQEMIDAIFEVTGLIAVIPMTCTLIAAVVQLMGTAVQLAVMVTAFPYFLRETV